MNEYDRMVNDPRWQDSMLAAKIRAFRKGPRTGSRATVIHADGRRTPTQVCEVGEKFITTSFGTFRRDDLTWVAHAGVKLEIHY